MRWLTEDGGSGDFDGGRQCGGGVGVCRYRVVICCSIQSKIHCSLFNIHLPCTFSRLLFSVTSAQVNRLHHKHTRLAFSHNVHLFLFSPLQTLFRVNVSEILLNIKKKQSSTGFCF